MKLKRLFLGLTGLSLALCLAGCDNAKDESGSYVTLEINPGVEFVVDAKGNVSAANGLNDDGKMLISEEELVGKDLDKAIEIVLNASVECKYLTEGENTKFTKEIKVSVSSATNGAQADLQASVTATVNDYVVENHLNAAAQALEAKSREYFEAIALQYDPSLTEEELAALSYEQLMNYVELATIEKAELVSMALEEYYLSFKEYQFELKCKEQIAEKLENISTISATLYSTAYNILNTAITAIDELQYNIFVSEESQYLKFLSEMQQLKDQNVKLTYQLSIGSTESEIEVSIQANNEAISKLEAKIVEIMDTFNASLEKAKSSIKSAIATLEELEKSISQINYIEILNEVENNINNTKTGLLNSFEEKYKDEITAAKSNVAARKAELEANVQ